MLESNIIRYWFKFYERMETPKKVASRGTVFFNISFPSLGFGLKMSTTFEFPKATYISSLKVLKYSYLSTPGTVRYLI